MVVDNGSFHKSTSLVIPQNITLMFLPPYSPELNPAEKVWWVLKQDFKCKTFKTLSELKRYLYKTVKKYIRQEEIQKLCSYDYLLTFLD